MEEEHSHLRLWRKLDVKLGEDPESQQADLREKTSSKRRLSGYNPVFSSEESNLRDV